MGITVPIGEMTIFEWVLCIDGLLTTSGFTVLAMNALLALLGHEGDMGGMFALCWLTYALIWRSCGFSQKIRKITEGDEDE